MAEKSGLALDNGIACDAEMRTSDPDIYAAGDCCSFPHGLYGGRRLRFEAWRVAQDQAAVAAENMLGGHRQFMAVPWFWSDQYELEPADRRNAVGRCYVLHPRQLKDDAFIEFHLDGEGRLVGASGIGRGNAIARDIKLAEMLIAKDAAPDPGDAGQSGRRLARVVEVACDFNLPLVGRSKFARSTEQISGGGLRVQRDPHP